MPVILAVISAIAGFEGPFASLIKAVMAFYQDFHNGNDLSADELSQQAIDLVQAGKATFTTFEEQFAFVRKTLAANNPGTSPEHVATIAAHAFLAAAATTGN